MMKRTFLTAVLSIMAFVVIPASPVNAVDLPDNLQILSHSVYRNLAEDGDVLVVFHGKVNYDSYNGTYPSTPASSTILLKLTADNGTLLAAAAPYVYSPFETNGYGDFVSGFYFDAESAPTWEGEHVITVSGLPAYFSPLPTPSNYTLLPADYEDSELQSINQLNLYAEIIGLCDTFISIYPDVTLKSTTDVGTVLSPYGEAYFKSAIPGLENLCPDLFYVQTYIPEVIAVEPYDTSLADDMAAHTEGGDLERGMTRAGAYIGVSGAFMWGIVTFICSIAICLYCMKRGWGIEPGIGLSSLIVILVAVLIGDFMFNLMMIIALIAAIGIMYVVALRRA